ncbi:MAG TPA: histidine kinase [Streptosporangiaceae bacterium]|nr:histidine kinase [Streptosporangiaceae bacterium]
MGVASPRRRTPGQAAGSGTSWPGSLVERALALVAADYRRPTGPVVMAVALGIAAVLGGGKTAGPLRPDLAIALGLLATLPIAVIRRFPAAAIGVMLAASAVFVVFGRLSWSVAAVVGWLIAVAACPVMLPRRQAIWAIVAAEATVLLAPLGLGGNVTPWDASAAEALAVVAAWGAGEMLRARRQSAIEYAAAAEQVRYLSERDVVARERAGIARELHDVVAHHVSMIAVRAATAPFAIAGLPGPGQAAFAEIAEEARTALTELRVVLGVLRSPDGGSEAAPQPRIADLDQLLSRVASAGTDAELTTAGQVRPLPGSVELCCYRIVQEALTNAGRHAPASRVRVELCYQPDALSVRIGNGPPDRGTGSGQPRAGEHGPQAASGFGLTGLRERVAMLGGEFRAGPDGQGGFLVSAMLPALTAPGGDRA